MKNKASLYYLDDDGRLTTPEGTWQAGDITDIDMERWIAKKGKARETWQAKVIVNDGSQVLLDDYIYEDMHLIIAQSQIVFIQSSGHRSPDVCEPKMLKKTSCWIHIKQMKRDNCGFINRNKSCKKL